MYYVHRPFLPRFPLPLGKFDQYFSPCSSKLFFKDFPYPSVNLVNTSTNKVVDFLPRLPLPIGFDQYFDPYIFFTKVSTVGKFGKCFNPKISSFLNTAML